MLGMIVLLLSSCSRTEPGTHRFEVFEEDGVTVARTTGGPLHDGPLFEIEPLLVLRQDPSDPESLLFNPGVFLPGPEGKYFVCDRGSGRVAVYATGGEYLFSFGRKGEGPGEFRMMTLQSLSHGILSIFDYTLQRTSYFQTDGTLLATAHSPIGGYALGLARTPVGTILQSGVHMEQDGTTGLTQYSMTVATGTGRDTLRIIRTGLVGDSVRKVETMPDGSMISVGKALPFAGSPQITYYPGHGILATDGDRPELTWHDTNGRTRLHIRIDLPTVPVTAEMKQVVMERERANAEQYTNRSGRNMLPSDYDYPNTVGFWRQVTVDDEGWIWCLDVRSQEEHVEGESYLWHVIDDEGRYIGTTGLPTTRPRIAQGKVMCFIVDPETGDRAATVFTLQPAVEGLIYPR